MLAFFLHRRHDTSKMIVDLDTAEGKDTPATDVLVVGGGPAGLTAAIYLARFHLNVVVIDRGGGRATLIPNTRNHAGFPDGISGQGLIDRMQRQATHYGARLIEGAVSSIARDADDFVASSSGGAIRARAVLLATGVANRRPPIDDVRHEEALRRGLIRYCPICDGYEVTDSNVAVIGTGERGVREAMFLRGYTATLTLVAVDGPHDLDDAQRRDLGEAGIVLRDGPIADIAISGEAITLVTPEGPMSFDTAYPALGSDVHSELAAQLGAQTSEDGCLLVDSHQRTDVAGLYAAGDVVFGLDQISHAMGEGGIAATTIRNDLAERSPIRRAKR